MTARSGTACPAQHKLPAHKFAVIFANRTTSALKTRIGKIGRAGKLPAIAAQISGVMSFVGHCFPIWLSFRGGKGVATFLGVMLGLAWPVGLACCLTWLVAAVVTRISSMAAIYMAALSTIWMVFLGYSNMFVLGIILTLFIFLRHAANIRRLRDRTEPKIGQQ